MASSSLTHSSIGFYGLFNLKNQLLVRIIQCGTEYGIEQWGFVGLKKLV